MYGPAARADVVDAINKSPKNIALIFMLFLLTNIF
jgi:hypothetical protein